MGWGFVLGFSLSFSNTLTIFPLNPPGHQSQTTNYQTPSPSNPYHQSPAPDFTAYHWSPYPTYNQNPNWHYWAIPPYSLPTTFFSFSLTIFSLPFPCWFNPSAIPFSNFY